MERSASHPDADRTVDVKRSARTWQVAAVAVLISMSTLFSGIVAANHPTNDAGQVIGQGDAYEVLDDRQEKIPVLSVPRADVPASPAGTAHGWSWFDIPDRDDLWKEDDDVVLAQPPLWQCDSHVDAVGAVDGGLPEIRLGVKTPYPIHATRDDPRHHGIARLTGTHVLVPEVRGPDASEVSSVTASLHPVASARGPDVPGVEGEEINPDDDVCDQLGVAGSGVGVPSLRMKRSDIEPDDGWAIRMDAAYLPDGLYVLSLDARVEPLTSATGADVETFPAGDATRWTVFTYAMVWGNSTCGQGGVSCGGEFHLPASGVSVYAPGSGTDLAGATSLVVDKFTDHHLTGQQWNQNTWREGMRCQDDDSWTWTGEGIEVAVNGQEVWFGPPSNDEEDPSETLTYRSVPGFSSIENHLERRITITQDDLDGPLQPGDVVEVSHVLGKTKTTLECWGSDTEETLWRAETTWRSVV